MKSFFVLILSLSSLLYSASPQDHWKGDQYAKNSESQKSSAEDFLQGFTLKGNEAILDVGCGDGKITAAMAKAVPEGTVVGVDISSSMIQMAKTAFPSTKNLNFQIEDAAKLKFEQKFDIITSFTVMQWVLEQHEALAAFERALKPQGKVWIQMPTGLPKAMSEALEKTISNPKWKGYFTEFSAPWRFYQKEEYRALLTAAKLTPTRMDVITKHELFPTRAAFHGFLKQWFPYLRPLPAEQKESFLTDLLDRYLEILPADKTGKVSFIVDRLEVEATK